MNGLKMTAAGREITMYFDTQAWLDVEKEFGSMSAMYELMEEDKNPMLVNLRLAEITARAGARHEAGEGEESETPVTLAWLIKNLTPKQAKRANTLAKLAVAQGMQRENVDDEDEDIDVVAQELQKKSKNP